MGNIQKIKPSGIFTNYIFKSIPLAFDESLSYYEVLCGVLDLLKTQEQVINNNADLLAELESYVKNYFENLDVQKEINNKLDKMAEDGTLENLIGQYIELMTTYTYNNVNEMQNATNLVNGSFARTSGFYEYNDGGGAYYKIRQVTNEDVIDNMHIFSIINDNLLIAELIQNDSINILQLGAYKNNDTKTDQNTSIIQYALNNYKEIIIPVGDFYVGSLVLPEKTNLTGIERLTSNLIYNGGNNKNFISTANGNEEEKYFNYIKNIHLSNNEKNNINGIYIITSYINVENCYIKGFNNGIEIVSCNNIVVKNNEILYNSNCGIKSVYNKIGHGQINAVYIKDNNISWNKYGIMFSGNNVIIENNTIQANSDNAICVNEPDWDGSYNTFTFNSVIQNNYTELTGRDNLNPPIAIYSGYVVGRPYNRIIRNLIIENNYFSEENNTNDNIIYNIITDMNSDPSSKATALVIKNNNSNSNNPLYMNYAEALSFGCEIENNSSLNSQKNIPFYVKQSDFEKNTPNLRNNGYDHIEWYNSFVGSANSTKQYTILIYPKNDNPNYSIPTNNEWFIFRSVVKAFINGNKEYGNAGKYLYNIERNGSNIEDYEGKFEFKADLNSEGYVPAVSPISLITNHPNFQSGVTNGYQISIMQKETFGFPCNVYLDILTDPNIIKYMNVEIIQENKVTGSTVPTNNADYIGQLYYNSSNNTWYVATNTTGGWREVSTN